MQNLKLPHHFWFNMISECNIMATWKGPDFRPDSNGSIEKMGKNTQKQSH